MSSKQVSLRSFVFQCSATNPVKVLFNPDSEQAVVTEQWVVQGLETDGENKGDF